MKTVPNLIDEYITWYLQDIVYNHLHYNGGWFLKHKLIIGFTDRNKVEIDYNFSLDLMGMFKLDFDEKGDWGMRLADIVANWLIKHKEAENINFWKNDENHRYTY